MAHWRPRVNTGIPVAGKLVPRTSGSSSSQDSYIAKVITYIPGETIAAYQAAVGFVPAGSPYLAYFAVFLLVFTPLWLLFATRDPGERLAWYQAIVGFLAFLVWLFVVESSFWDWLFPSTGPDGGAKAIPGYVRSLVLIGTTLVFPLIERILSRFGFKV